MSWAVAAAPIRTILIVGDSLSAAHNIPLDAGWPQLLQQRLSRRHCDYRVVNASISGETTSTGRHRLPALLKAHHPAIVIIELGANDGLRGLSLSHMRDNLAAMIRASQASGARVLLLGIELPVNYGPVYRDRLRQVYKELAARYHTALLPFLLQGVALDPSLMQEDGLHPTAAGEPKVLENVWTVLKPLLN